jgi:hypothetical protein
MAGLDPAIQRLANASKRRLDHRVKPGDDDYSAAVETLAPQGCSRRRKGRK